MIDDTQFDVELLDINMNGTDNFIFGDDFLDGTYKE
jgi:hypothetical protein